MLLSPSDFLILLTCGFFISLLGSLFGLGGGIFIVPLLYFGFNLPMHEAIACSLLCITAASMMSAMAKVRTGMINIRLSKMLEISSILGAIFGALVLQALNVRVIKVMFITITTFMAWNMLRDSFKKLRGKTVNQYFIPENTSGEYADSYEDKSDGKTVVYETQNVLRAVPVSLGSGMLS